MGLDAAGYTSSYTPNDPTHPLDPRKIFSRSFWPDPTEQTVRYSFDVRGFNLGDYVLVPRSPRAPLLFLFFSLVFVFPFRDRPPLSLDPYPMVYHIRRETSVSPTTQTRFIGNRTNTVLLIKI